VTETTEPRGAEACRRFQLIRREDETGISGTGVVAYGVAFPDGRAVLRWDTKVNSTVLYESLADLEAIHGHGGKTVVHWLDPAMPAADLQTAWRELTGYVSQAEADGDRLDPSALLAYMRELSHRAHAPGREYLKKITEETP
jgi:hypothetical protein